MKGGGIRMIKSESKLYSSLPLLGSYKTWSEIDLDALRANWRLLRRAVTSPDGQTPRMIAVVKADAYGHGADACAEAGMPMIYAAYGLGEVKHPWKQINAFPELLDILE